MAYGTKDKISTCVLLEIFQNIASLLVSIVVETDYFSGYTTKSDIL